VKPEWRGMLERRKRRAALVAAKPSQFHPISKVLDFRLSARVLSGIDFWHADVYDSFNADGKLDLRHR
jgi:hypothetical protein